MDQKLKHALLQKQVQEAGVMNAFCYAYLRLLLDKLIKLQQENSVFTNNACGERDGEQLFELTSIGNVTIINLCENIQGDRISQYSSLEEINKLIETVVEFLAIFEK